MGGYVAKEVTFSQSRAPSAQGSAYEAGPLAKTWRAHSGLLVNEESATWTPANSGGVFRRLVRQMRFLKAMFGSKGHKERVEALQRALDKRNESVAVLKTRVDKLSQANGLLREENARLKSKVTELYDRNKDYAQRLRGDR